MGIGFRELLVVLAIGVFFVFVYLAPAFFAFHRGHKDRTAILILNLFGGWLFVPWLIALVWAFKK